MEFTFIPIVLSLKVAFGFMLPYIFGKNGPIEQWFESKPKCTLHM